MRQPAYQPAAYEQPYQQNTYQQPAPEPQGQPPQSQQYGYTPQQYAYQQAPASPPTGTAQNPASPGTRRGRRLSPGMIAFIAVDAILLVVAIVFAVNVLSGSGASPVDAGDEPDVVASQDAADDEDGDGGADDEAAQGTDPGASMAEFASPSRNISCEIFENQVTCKIAELNQQPAPVEGCDGMTGYVVTLDREGTVALPCVPTGEKPSTAGGGLDALSYGETATGGDFTCTSQEDGMYCQHDPSGQGFSLARAGVGTY
ncbi:hypothetical protein [Isoptericola halotolerans]|uniref:Uncharacterized protein n=1 Tax=Isoptericola halotolerans TaxID=300560 RepID=A0ABX2A537_9MICO|nr:hypothetical protein [Isoptericola halotolerans]NOV96706.1 hypothetical protein [Isoptericola halotolerans]